MAFFRWEIWKKLIHFRPRIDLILAFALKMNLMKMALNGSEWQVAVVQVGHPYYETES